MAINQVHFKGKVTIKLRMFDFFDERGTADFPMPQLTKRFHCSKNLAWRYRRQWREQHQHQPQPDVERCTRCGFAGWETNLIGPDGICLWCRAAEAGIDLGEYVKQHGWKAVLEELQ